MVEKKRVAALVLVFLIVLTLVLYASKRPAVAPETPSDIEPLVDLDKVISGGPPRDSIPAIDEPKFVPLEEADAWIEDNELVLAITYKGVKRAYPLQIMVWHEIVNDVIAGDPILVTYCPLCGSGI